MYNCLYKVININIIMISNLNFIEGNLCGVEENAQPRISQNFSQGVRSCLERIGQVICKVLQIIAGIFAFPIRYIGAKSWSIPGVLFRLPYALFQRIFHRPVESSLKEQLFGKGYHFSSQELVSKREMTSQEDYAKEMKEKAARYFAYACSIVWVDRSIPVKWVNPLENYGYTIISNVDDVNMGPNLKFQESSGCFFDQTSGLKIAIYESLSKGRGRSDYFFWVSRFL